MFALAIALSLAGLAIGPALAAIGRGRVIPSAALDGLTLGLVPALIGLHLVPHLFEHLGPGALALPAAGFFGLWLVERRSHDVGARVGRSVVVPAIVIHSLSDGAGLGIAAAASEAGSSTAFLLTLTIILHRMPEGLFLVTTLLPDIGWRRTLMRLGLVAAATVVGAIAGRELLEDLPHEILDAFVAVGLGMMLRLVVHSHNVGAASPGTLARCAAGAGFVVGLGLALAIPVSDDVLAHALPRELPLADSLGRLFVCTAPPMLAGLLLAGALSALLPTASARGASSRARRLLVAGAPTSAVVAFVISAPELDPISAALSLQLLGWPLTIARVGAGALLALVVAWITAAAARTAAAQGSAGAARAVHGAADPEDIAAHAGHSAERRSPGERLRAAVTEALGPTLDRVAAWYVVGLIAAATLEAFFAPELAARAGAPADVVVGGLAAVPLAVGAQGAIPLAAVMVHKGTSVGAALAFMLIGPTMSVAAFGVLRRHLGWRAAIGILLAHTSGAIAAGLAANALIPATTLPELHALITGERSIFEWVAAAILGALLLASLIRRGPRVWFGAMLPDGHPRGCGHTHDPHATQSHP